MRLDRLLLARLNAEQVTGWKAYALAVLVPLLISVLAYAFLPILDIANTIMLFLLGVFLCAIWLGKRASLLAALWSVLLFDLIFVPPVLGLITNSVEYLITLTVMLLVTVLTGQLTAMLLAQNRALVVSEEQTAALYHMASELAGAVDQAQVDTIANRYPRSAATASLLSIARERLRYADLAQTNRVQVESERLRSALLSTISHDLRTPLTSLVGLTETFNTHAQGLSATQQDMVEAIHEQAVRLAAMVTKILDFARLSAGQMRLHKEWQPIEEVIGTALQLLSLALSRHHVTLTIPPNFPLLAFDAVLMERVIGNLLENAAKYTPSGTNITITVQQYGEYALIAICDEGAGFPPSVLFANVQATETLHNECNTAAGLGLAICEAILKAHDGRLCLKQRTDGITGSCACFQLPLGEPPTMDDDMDANE